MVGEDETVSEPSVTAGCCCSSCVVPFIAAVWVEDGRGDGDLSRGAETLFPCFGPNGGVNICADLDVLGKLFHGVIFSLLRALARGVRLRNLDVSEVDGEVDTVRERCRFNILLIGGVSFFCCKLQSDPNGGTNEVRRFEVERVARH